MASIKKIEGKNGNSYKITVTCGRDINGKQIRHYKTYTPDKTMTARQIEKELNKVVYEFEREIELGYQSDNRQTFAEYAEYYVNMRTQRGDKIQGIENAKRLIKRLNEYIGNMKLKDIRPQHINRIYAEFMKPGSNQVPYFSKAFPIVDFNTFITGTQREFAELCGVSRKVMLNLRNGKPCDTECAERICKALNRNDLFRYEKKSKPLSTGTIKAYHELLCSIFSRAVNEMIIPYNPAQKATPPQKIKSSPEYLQPDELQRVIEALEEEPIKLKTLITLMAVTGCRRGEILALKWNKVDFISRQLKIDASLNYSPSIGKYEGKTKTSNTRYVPITKEVTRLLLEYKKWLDSEAIKHEGEWLDTDYVFRAEKGASKGGPMHPGALNMILDEFSKRHSLPKLHPHMFRHTAASIMLSSGVDVLTVSKILGHAETSTTLNVYGHEIYSAKEKAIEDVTEVILKKA